MAQCVCQSVCTSVCPEVALSRPNYWIENFSGHIHDISGSPFYVRSLSHFQMLAQLAKSCAKLKASVGFSDFGCLKLIERLQINKKHIDQGLLYTGRTNQNFRGQNWPTR